MAGLVPVGADVPVVAVPLGAVVAAAVGASVAAEVAAEVAAGVPVPVPFSTSLASWTVMVSHLPPVTGTAAVADPFVVGAVVAASVAALVAAAVAASVGASVKALVGDPSGSVAAGARVLMGALVGVAAVPQAVKIRTSTAIIPNNFG